MGKSKKMVIFFYVFFIFAFFTKICLSGEISLKCTVEYCDDYVQKFPCPPLDPDCFKPSISLVIPSATTCNCCEQCFLFQELGGDCVVGKPGDPLPKVMCKPGTKCESGKCKKMSSPDPDFYPVYKCDGDACYCTVLKNNELEKIFGKFDKKDIKDERQCACSISALAAQESINRFLPIPNVFVPTPRCLPNGQFDPLQCFDNLCGCVNRTTGVWDSSVKMVPVSALGPKNPKCFDVARHKIGQYYTKCEKERNNLMSDISSQESNAVDVLLSHSVKCNPDGEYANSR